MKVLTFRSSLALAIYFCWSSLGIAVVAHDVPWGEAEHDRILAGKGRTAHQTYFQIGGAEVNAFNFNFTVQFSEQVGAELPVDGGLSASLSRAYNSTVSRRKSWQCRYLSSPNDLDCIIRPPSSKQYYSVSRQNPMGLGWEFHLGRVYKKGKTFCGPQMAGPECCSGSDCSSGFGEPGMWTYIAPDGAEHTLFQTAGTPIYITRDGSMIRGKALGAGGDNGPWEIYLPDGRILEMGHQVSGTTFAEVDETAACTSISMFRPGKPPAGEYDRDKIGWHTSRIRGREQDGSGTPKAWVRVDYQAAPFDYIIKTVYDSHNGEGGADREIDVVISTVSGTIGFGHITEVHYPSPPDQNSTPRAKAIFAFHYEQTVGSNPIELLTRVDMPGGYAFKYEYAGPSAITGVYRLSKIWYPSGKLVKLAYGTHTRLWRTVTDTNGGEEYSPYPCACANKPDMKDDFIGLSSSSSTSVRFV